MYSVVCRMPSQSRRMQVSELNVYVYGILKQSSLGSKTAETQRNGRGIIERMRTLDKLCDAK